MPALLLIIPGYTCHASVSRAGNHGRQSVTRGIQASKEQQSRRNGIIGFLVMTAS